MKGSCSNLDRHEKVCKINSSREGGVKNKTNSSQVSSAVGGGDRQNEQAHATATLPTVRLRPRPPPPPLQRLAAISSRRNSCNMSKDQSGITIPTQIESAELIGWFLREAMESGAAVGRSSSIPRTHNSRLRPSNILSILNSHL